MNMDINKLDINEFNKINRRERIDIILNSISKRLIYNLEQTFVKLREDFNDTRADYSILDIELVNGMQTIKMFIDFNLNGQSARTVLYSQDLRKIKRIYNILTSVIE